MTNKSRVNKKQTASDTANNKQAEFSAACGNSSLKGFTSGPSLPSYVTEQGDTPSQTLVLCNSLEF